MKYFCLKNKLQSGIPLFYVYFGVSLLWSVGTVGIGAVVTVGWSLMSMTMLFIFLAAVD